MALVSRFGATALGCLVVGIVGCAGGDSAGGTPGTPTPTSAGSQPSTGSAETGDDGDDDDDDAYGSSTGESSATSGTAGASSTGGAGETGDESSGGETGQAEACVPDNTCPMALVIGGVAGDESSPNVTHSGASPTWLGVEVSEQNASAFGEALSVTLTLESRGGDFDLRAFRGSSGGSSGCNGAEKSSELVGMPDSVRFSFGEGAIANNSDDGAPIAIEVFAKGQVCVDGASWTLTVVGNT